MIKEDLIKQCMDSGWFTSEENAHRYVERYCMPKKVEDVIEKWNLKSEVFDTKEDKLESESLRIERMASPEGL